MPVLTNPKHERFAQSCDCDEQADGKIFTA